MNELLQILTFAKFSNSSLSVQIANIKAAWRQYSHRQPSVNYSVFSILLLSQDPQKQKTKQRKFPCNLGLTNSCFLQILKDL